MESDRTMAARVERALASLWKRQCQWMPGGRSLQVGSATMVMTNCESESLRGPALYLADSDTSVIDQAIEHAESLERGLAIDLMRGLRGGVAEYAHGIGFERIVSRQLMVADPKRVAGGLSAQACRPDQLDDVRSMQQRCFTLSEADVTALYPPTILGVEETELVVVQDNDNVVAAATVHRDVGTIGIFGVGCEPSHRGRGFGSAVTNAALNLAAIGGDDLCWLQATDDVAPFYGRLGFETLETCDVWASSYV